MKIKLLTVCLLLAASVQAKPVLWYRLDGFATGEKTTASTRIDNLAVPGQYMLTCHSYIGTARGTDAEYMPFGTEGMPAGILVYDPVTQTSGERRNALHFGLDEIPEGVVDGNGAMLRTTSSTAELGLKTVTVEAIFRMSPGAISEWKFAPIVYQHGKNNMAESFTLAIGWNGCISCRFNANDKSKAIIAEDVTFLPDVWHHAAFTLDENGTAKLYLDYVQVQETKNNGTLTQFTNKYFMIGANTHYDKRTFPGDILEVRVFDEAVGPEQFLRVRVPSRETPSDTIAYVPDFNALGYKYSRLVDINTAHGTSAIAAYPMQEESSPEAIVDTTEKAAQAFRFGINDENGLTPNAGSIYSTTNGVRAGHGIRLATESANLEEGSFTMECFFKAEREMTGELQYGAWCIFYTPCMNTYIMEDSGVVASRSCSSYPRTYEPKNFSTIYSTERYDDGKWHHIAYVYDKDAGLIQLYLDKVRVGALEMTLGTNASGLPSYAFLQENTDPQIRQYFPGWVDEFRVTARALSPAEFMLSDPVREDSILAHYSFEENYADSAYPSINQTGKGAARSGGEVPQFDTASCGDVLLDGENGSNVLRSRHSLRLAGSQLQISSVPLLERDSFTVECFAKITAADKGVGFLRQNQSSTLFEGNTIAPRWMLYLSPNTEREYMQCRLDINGYKLISFDTMSEPFADGKWHHWAIVFETQSDETTKTVVSLYRDYNSLGTRTLDGKMSLPKSDACGFTIGANNNLSGYIDELRFSDGVLPVEKFMHTRPTGTVVILQ